MFMYLFMMLTTCEHSLSVVFSMVYHDFLCIFPLVFHINVPLFVLLFSLNISPRSVRLVIAGGADGGAPPDASRAPRAAPARRVGGFELVEPIIIIVV